jgi:hypothetical protein
MAAMAVRSHSESEGVSASQALEELDFNAFPLSGAICGRGLVFDCGVRGGIEVQEKRQLRMSEKTQLE